ncbi:unnamed protein product [Adineta steineri]|uniref:DDE-1 domain-containing protein n=1 Tax=Adineta steineri TaxID=433720 RepID=A0A813YSL4_9BILA|nr:unnamed protein product [Adineta steineri]CAF3873533.1 unnamed protein product [Adineta steineri]
MDESPLALFSDQAKKCVNDIDTINEINGCISKKKFCTLILTVFGENQRTTPVLFFKGKGHISADERQQYSKGVHIILSPKAVINVPSMNIFITKWWKMIVVSVIPKGCTQYLQVLDTSVFSVFKNHYQAAIDEYIDRYGSCRKVKLSAREQQIICARLTCAARLRT